MSYMECSEFVETSRKFKEQIRSGAEIIKKIAKSMNRDDEYFESGHRRTFLEPLDQQLKSLLKYDQDLHNHIESFRSTLFQVDHILNEDLFGENQQIEPHKLFEQHMTTCQQATNNEPIENDVRVKELEQLLTVEEPVTDEDAPDQPVATDEDFAIENSQSDHIPMDPFSRHEVEEPVRNKHCKHVYDKKGITTYIIQSRRARCPVIGCGNRQVITFNDLIEDRELSARIHRIRHRRKAQGQL